jgi:hypothetical protein
VAGWSTLLETYEATPVESWAFRQLLRGLAPVDQKHKLRPTETVSHPQSVTVVTLAGDERGVAIAPQLVAFALIAWFVTRLVTAVGQESAAALWAACVAERETNARQGLHFGDVSAEVTIDLTIILVIVDASSPTSVRPPASEATILAVAPGTATEQELARVALAVDDSGRSIDESWLQTLIRRTVRRAGTPWTSERAGQRFQYASRAYHHLRLPSVVEAAGDHDVGRLGVPDFDDDQASPGGPAPSLVSLHFIRSALRRRWLACLLSAVMGLFLAAAFLMAFPALHDAKTALILHISRKRTLPELWRQMSVS